MTSQEYESTYGMPDYHWVVFTRLPDGRYSISDPFQLSQKLDLLFPDSKVDNEDFGLPPPSESST